MNRTKLIAKLPFTFTTIPRVIKIKYMTSSDGFFTGVLNLTIESAPTNPKERAMLSEIIVVTPYAIKGNSKNASELL